MAQVHAVSGEVVSLKPLGAGLAAAKSSAILKAPQLELIRLVLLAGRSLPEHQVAGEITLLCLEGQVDVSTPSGVLSLQAQDLLHLAGGMPHGLVALTDASLLLTIRL
jgi:quercetin dioxygenase-like cupin family protein